MKKWFYLPALLLSVCLLFTGCNQEPTPEETTVSQETSSSGTENDSDDILQSALEFYARMEKETEGMSKDDTVDHWLRESLALLKDKLPEEKSQQLTAVFKTLHEKELLEEVAVYNAENQVFTYLYDSGIMGGLTVKERNPVSNGTAGGSNSSIALSTPSPTGDAETNLYSAYTNTELQAIILNGFEDTPYRRDYYNVLREDWTEMGVQVTLDTDVTVADMANLSPYDVVIFSMHGGTYNNRPILALNEVPSYESDMEYYSYLVDEGSAGKMMYVDGTCAYWIFPEFFTCRYGEDGLDGKVIFSEACCFYGCDCYCTEADVSMAGALANASAEAVIGYYNSVGANYSRNTMATTLEQMFDGETVSDALAYAIGVHGENDNWQDASQDKYYSYPLYMGNEDTVIVDIATEIFVPEIPEIPVPDYSELMDFDYASEQVYNSLMDQLIGVYAHARNDATYYLPYYNDTDYIFSFKIDLEYHYSGNVVSRDRGYSYSLRPGEYVEIPVKFPYFCDAWTVYFEYYNIFYKGTLISQ